MITQTAPATRIIDAYRIEITQGYYAGEEGSAYSLEPWGGDPTGHYQGSSEPVKVRIPENYEVVPNKREELILVPRGESTGITLPEAIRAKIARVIR